MKKELRDRWCAALRSGEYRQGRDALQPEDDRFCCIGVLASIVAPELWDHEEGLHDGAVGEMSPRVRELTGLSALDEGRAIGWNDKDEHDFATIAELIEHEIPIDNEPAP